MTSKKYEIDIEKIINLVKEMLTNALAIINMIPESQEHLLKNIAACSIHLSFFMRDFVMLEKLTVIKDLEETKIIEKDFLDKCGCNIPNCS